MAKSYTFSSLTGQEIPGEGEEHIKAIGASFAKQFAKSKPKSAGYPIKSAEDINAPNESIIEQTLAAAAEEKVATAVPKLMPYGIGFQLLKKSDDSTKGAGIFVFKVGKELVYIPAVIVGDSIRGIELMYIASKDKIVPADSENVSDLLAKTALDIGVAETREPDEMHSQRSFRMDERRSGLKLSSYRNLPRELWEPGVRGLIKYAAMDEEGVGRKYKAAFDAMNVDDLLLMSLQTSKRAEFWSQRYPVFADVLKEISQLPLHEHVSTLEARKENLKKAGVRIVRKPTLQEVLSRKTAEAPKPLKSEAVKVIKSDDIPDHQWKFMEPATVENVHRDGFMIDDKRKNTAEVVYKSDIHTVTEPGVYQTFFNDGSFKECEIWRIRERNYGGANDIRDGGSNDYLVIHDGLAARWKGIEITVSGHPDPLPLKKHGKAADAESDCCCTPVGYLLTPDGCAFAVDAIENSGNGYDIKSKWEDYDVVTILTDSDKMVFPVYGEDKSRPMRNKTILAPADTRYFGIKAGVKDLPLGSRAVFNHMANQTSYRLKVRRNTDGKFATGKMKSAEFVGDFADTIKHLLEVHDLSEKDARYFCEAAAKSPLKFAEGEVYVKEPKKIRPEFEGLLNAGIDSATGLDTFTGNEHLQLLEQDYDTKTIFEQSPAEVAPKDYPLPDAAALAKATEAAGKGEKNIVNAEVLMSLLKDTDNTEIIAKYVPVFTRTVDALGRMYLSVIWGWDHFTDVFGDKEISDFSDQTIELFKDLGDFVQFLKHRDIKDTAVIEVGDTSDLENDATLEL